MDINLPRCIDTDYIDFLIGASNVSSCTEAARCYPIVDNAPAHESFNRLLIREQDPRKQGLKQSEKRKFLACPGKFRIFQTSSD